LKNLLFDIRLQEGTLNFTAQGKETSLFHAAAAYRLIPMDWNITVRDSIRISVTGPWTGPWQVNSKLSLDDLVFQNKDGTIMGENVSLSTGIPKGQLRDVEMAYGQPQKFNLLLETVQKKGIPQKISVKAAENIAQIGAGQSPFMGVAGAFASFFKKFPYEKIGIRASLENDVFTVNGTIKEGGTEYLGKRGSFSGVNVVNQNPDNRISFKDMVKRIKRIGATEGPVVK
jgi:hypothetical protein